MADFQAVLLVSSDKRVGDAKIADLRKQLAELLPAVGLLVLDDGIKFGALLSPDKIA